MVLPFYLFTFLPFTLHAQSFTQRIQQQKPGQGTVTIHQSAEIDYMVNSEQLSTKRTATGTTTSTTPATAKPTTEKPAAPTIPSTASASATSSSADSQSTPPEAVDTSKKVIRNGVKVNGFRVQAFAGGNSRADRQKAEQIGNNIKAQFGNVPVYVHFYSPRWICRVGNYRTYEEAHQMLVSLRKMGYTQASIVKGKITVQY